MASLPRYLVAQDLVSNFFNPNAIACAYGCQIVIAFIKHHLIHYSKSILPHKCFIEKNNHYLFILIYSLIFSSSYPFLSLFSLISLFSHLTHPFPRQPPIVHFVLSPSSFNHPPHASSFSYTFFLPCAPHTPLISIFFHFFLYLSFTLSSSPFPLF